MFSTLLRLVSNADLYLNYYRIDNLQIGLILTIPEYLEINFYHLIYYLL